MASDDHGRHHHADLFRLPGDAVIADEIADALRAHGIEHVRLESRLSPAWTTDWIQRRAAAAQGLRHRAAEAPGAADRMPALRLGRHRAHQPVRLDALQGAVPMPGLPRTVRLFQVLLADHEQFHPLTVSEVRRETRETVVVVTRRAGRARARLPLHPGPAPDPARQHRRRGRAPLLLDLRRARMTASAGGHQARAGRAVFDLGQRRAATRAHRRDAADGPLPRAAGPGHRKHYVAFAAGSGITPLLDHQDHADAEPHSRFTLFYGNRASSSVIFKEELEDLKDEHLERLSLAYVMSREQQDIELFNGRIPRQMPAIVRHWIDIGTSTWPSSAARRT